MVYYEIRTKDKGVLRDARRLFVFSEKVQRYEAAWENAGRRFGSQASLSFFIAKYAIKSPADFFELSGIGDKSPAVRVWAPKT